MAATVSSEAPRTDTLVSVVIPTFHRDHLLSLCLDRLAPGSQRGAVLVRADRVTVDAAVAENSYEVIVTDAGVQSTAADMIRARYPWVRWTACPGRGPAANRNNGARLATGEWLLFVDDDCLPTEDLLSAVATCSRRHAVDIVEGSILIKDKIDSPFRRQPENRTGGLYWSGNLAVRRQTFFDVGAFDEDYEQAACDDLDLAARLRRRGVAAAFCAEAVVWHPSQRESLRSLLHRSALLRWHLLYRLKNGGSAPLAAAPVTALYRLVLTHCLDEARTTWHLVSRRDRAEWKARLFWKAWSLATLPILLPYLMVWELRFRRMLLARTVRDVSSCESPL